MLEGGRERNGSSSIVSMLYNDASASRRYYIVNSASVLQFKGFLTFLAIRHSKHLLYNVANASRCAVRKLVVQLRGSVSYK
jgi:hypothetical protein